MAPSAIMFAMRRGHFGLGEVAAAVQEKVWLATGGNDPFDQRLIELKVPRHIRERLLDHADDRGSGADYDHHEYADEQRSAVEL
jgi:hypothetical protein